MVNIFVTNIAGVLGEGFGDRFKSSNSVCSKPRRRFLVNMVLGCCKAETFRQTWHNIFILCLSFYLPVKFQSTKITVSEKVRKMI